MIKIMCPQSQAHNNHSHYLSTHEIITHDKNTTQFYSIDNDNTDEPFEHRKPTIYERFDNIHISLDQVKSQIKITQWGKQLMMMLMR